MNLLDYFIALNKAAAGQSATPQSSGQGEAAAPTTGAEQPNPSPWKLFFGDLLNLAQAQWAPAGWTPYKF
jgi:hypothetical protein